MCVKDVVNLEMWVNVVVNPGIRCGWRGGRGLEWGEIV
jgi:hypothetical protein